MIKKIICLTLCALMAFALCSCSSPAVKDEGGDSGKLKIISTIFPGYDFAKAVAGDKADVSILVPPGGESHSYEPTPKDIIDIQKCDLFIYCGGLSDAWVDGVLDSMDEVNTLRMVDCVDMYEEEILSVMTADEEEDEGEPEYDEHVWTSPANAVKITEAIRDKIIEADGENSGAYTANADAYINELNALDGEFRTFFEENPGYIFIFGDRFPLRYFVEEYGVGYFAAFPGCSSETEPSAKTISALISTAKEKGIKTIFYIEFSNHKVADSIAESVGGKTALFHTCHNVATDDIEAGATYVSLMTQNLETLKENLQ